MRGIFDFLMSMAKVGCIGFGGGSALIPVIEDEIIQKREIDTKANYDKDVIVANITPGALPVELASSLGRRYAGNAGMVLSPVMMGLPGTIGAILLFTVLAFAQEEFLDIIELISIAVSAFVIYLLVDYMIRVLTDCGKESQDRLRKAVIVMTGVFVLVCGKNLNKLLGSLLPVTLHSFSTLHILLAAFAYAIVTSTKFRPGNKQAGHEKIRFPKQAMHQIGSCSAIWIAILAVFTVPTLIYGWSGVLLAGKGVVSALMSFGGGDAYLTIADGLFVESNMISPDTYYGKIVPVVNILPGSILCKTLAGVGYFIGFEAGGTVQSGVLYAATGFISSIASSCGFFFVIYYLYDSLSSFGAVRKIGRWIRPIIAGLLGNVILSLCNQGRNGVEVTGLPFAGIVAAMAVMAAADLFMVRKFGWKPAMTLFLNICIVFLVAFCGM